MLNKTQNIELRALRNDLLNDSLEEKALMGLFNDFVFDKELKSLMETKGFSEICWVCLKNKSQSRNNLIENSFKMLTMQGLKEDKCVEIISIALFLGGVDSAITEVKVPSLAGIKKTTDRIGKNHGTNSISGGTTSRLTDVPSKGFDIKPWHLGIVVVSLIVAVVCLFSGKDSETDAQDFKWVEICRSYEGTIDTDNGKLNYNLDVRLQDGNSKRVHLSAVNAHKPTDKKQWSAKVNGNKMEIDGSIILFMSKNKNDRMVLQGNNKHEKWYFVSKK